jgi:hypothetical protein
MECLGCIFIDPKIIKVIINTASIRHLALHAGVPKNPDKSLRIGRYCSKAKGLQTFKILQARRARSAAKRLLKKSSLSPRKGRCNNQLLCHNRIKCWCNRVEGHVNGRGEKRGEADAGERDNVGCALLSSKNPSPSDDGIDEGGQESIELICPSLQSVWRTIGNDGGYGGGGEKRGKAVDTGECSNVGCALLSSENLSPSDNGVDEGGQESIGVIRQSSRSVWHVIGDNGGYGGGEEKQGKAVDAGAGECNDVGCALLSSENPSPSDNGVDEEVQESIELICQSLPSECRGGVDCGVPSITPDT